MFAQLSALQGVAIIVNRQHSARLPIRKSSNNVGGAEKLLFLFGHKKLSELRITLDDEVVKSLLEMEVLDLAFLVRLHVPEHQRVAGPVAVPTVIV